MIVCKIWHVQQFNQIIAKISKIQEVLSFLSIFCRAKAAQARTQPPWYRRLGPDVCSASVLREVAIAFGNWFTRFTATFQKLQGMFCSHWNMSCNLPQAAVLNTVYRMALCKSSISRAAGSRLHCGCLHCGALSKHVQGISACLSALCPTSPLPLPSPLPPSEQCLAFWWYNAPLVIAASLTPASLFKFFTA